MKSNYNGKKRRLVNEGRMFWDYTDGLLVGMAWLYNQSINNFSLMYSYYLLNYNYESTNFLFFLNFPYVSWINKLVIWLELVLSETLDGLNTLTPCNNMLIVFVATAVLKFWGFCP